MASLVAYEDSESEEEPEDPSTGSHEPNQDIGVCDKSNTSSKTRTFHPDDEETLLGNHGNTSGTGSSSLSPPQHPNLNYCGNWATQRENVTAPLSLPATREKISTPQTLPHMPPSWGNVSHQAKRQHSVPPGVQPYIPKRQRLGSAVATVDPSHPAHRGNQAENILEVSARVKPYLSQKPRVAKAPRRLLMRLEGHQGPVNTVKWCPVPHLSHLLLSASMDKTLKVWDGVESGRCLRIYNCHSGAVRAACWTPCGRHLLSGSFDNTAVITDVETGQQRAKLDNQFKVMCAALHPSSPDVVLCGGYSSVVKAWDSRTGKMVKTYKAGIQQTLHILFLHGGTDFITSSDCVSRDSADRTLIAWDYQTTARLSNQIYHERYTCPSLALHPLEESFVAQTNGNYMAAFSSQPPYRMNKRRRYEGHKVEGYAVQCEFSHDGTILASGSATGSAHFYDYHNTRTLHTLQAHEGPCVCVTQHPILPGTAATCDWAGEIKVWH